MPSKYIALINKPLTCESVVSDSGDDIIGDGFQIVFHVRNFMNSCFTHYSWWAGFYSLIHEKYTV